MQNALHILPWFVLSVIKHSTATAKKEVAVCHVIMQWVHAVHHHIMMIAGVTCHII